MLNKLPSIFERLDLSMGFKMIIEEKVKDVRNSMYFSYSIIVILLKSIFS